jgi:hypothetical protein
MYIIRKTSRTHENQAKRRKEIKTKEDILSNLSKSKFPWLLRECGKVRTGWRAEPVLLTLLVLVCLNENKVQQGQCLLT